MEKIITKNAEQKWNLLYGGGTTAKCFPSQKWTFGVHQTDAVKYNFFESSWLKRWTAI